MQHDRIDMGEGRAARLSLRGIVKRFGAALLAERLAPEVLSTEARRYPDLGDVGA